MHISQVANMHVLAIVPKLPTMFKYQYAMWLATKNYLKQPNDKASLMTINFGNLAKHEFIKLLSPTNGGAILIPPIDTQHYIRVMAAKKHK